MVCSKLVKILTLNARETLNNEFVFITYESISSDFHNGSHKLVEGSIFQFTHSNEGDAREDDILTYESHIFAHGI